VSDGLLDLDRPDDHYQARKGTRNVVLEDVNLDVRQGEFVSVVGVSGCGKTTLLRMVAGLAPYYPGTIRVRGEIVRGIPPRVGFVFQNSALLPWRNVRENVELGLNEVRRTLSRSEREEMVEHQVRLMGLDGYGDYLPAKLSGGMQQRAGLARALVAEPDVLLMDEPFGAVDALTRLRLQEELASIVERTSATVVFVTHDVEEAVFLADRVAVMSINPGKITQIVDIEVPRPRERHADGEAGRRIAELREHVLSLVLGSDARSDGSLEQRKAVRL
jgi:NitT/TauT family transport system ATP-binding protein